jgi:polyhydroxyalkanoate synthesis regulator phasin
MTKLEKINRIKELEDSITEFQKERKAQLDERITRIKSDYDLVTNSKIADINKLVDSIKFQVEK